MVMKKVGLYILAIVFLIYAAYPIVYLISTSLKSQPAFFESPFSLFTHFTLDNYVAVIQQGLLVNFLNSIIVSVISVFVVMLIASLASYPLSRMKFKLNRAVFLLFIVGMMLPVHATLIPIFRFSNSIGIYDSLVAIIGPYIAFALPISIFILTQFMSEIPKSLEESAMMDGANKLKIFFHIILPMTRPALMTVFIYNFIHIWNEFIFALVLISNNENMTLPLGLRNFFGEYSTNVPAVMAAISLASIPMLLAYIFTQEKVTKGLTDGAVKG
ncbi:carbohydrate ABC transporter permease [Oceanobacillus sp. CFH 90083]|uniref:carbohydrate ABC transporter permease n=1 Tax=Oceanobacillus sp. CFH 90083 TaxID=2592336 RepID=UPI00128D0BD9|nr:carbohydrate ABC transporter permease [Oceanobacillus sp. CFH 90083]